MKRLVLMLFVIVIRCAAGTQEKVSEITWYPKLAITDSSQQTIITPGIITATKDTLFKIEQYMSNYQIRTVVWKTEQVCDWMQQSYEEQTNELQRINEEQSRLNEQCADVLKRRALLIDWYKKFKNTYGIDCQEKAK